MTGKRKSGISKWLPLHEKVEPKIQHAACSDRDTVLTKRQVYNPSKQKPEDQLALADEVQRKKLNAVKTERLVESRSPMNNPKRGIRIGKEIRSRQQRFRTSRAEVLMTFHNSHSTPEDIQPVLGEIAEQILSRAVE